MPDIGRWGVVDPLAEHSEDKTPYHYCSGNPINRLDPNGMCDDPNCSHSAVRRGWDSIGRFFGAWGSAEKKEVKAEITEFGPLESLGQWLDEPVDAGTAQAAEDLAHSSMPGNFTMADTNEGVVMSVAVAFGSAMQAANGFRYPAYQKGTSNSSKTVKVTQESVSQSLQDSNLQTAQGVVSGPMVERYVNKIQNGETAPPIKVTSNGVIVDGNHRYVAGKLTGTEPAQVPGTLSPSQQSKVQPVKNTKVDPNDWGGN